MIKTALNFICKNEAHIINRMLESALPLTDLIVAVDTGSTDNTKRLIQSFGEKHQIPAFIFDRTFDDFSNSRNYAIEKLRYIADQMNWNSKDVYGFTIDCDEVLLVCPTFKKEQLSADIYYIDVSHEGGAFKRQAFYKPFKELQWEGPVHEIITWKQSNITCEYLPGITIHSESKGGSWKQNLENKFLRHVSLLSKYIETGHNVFRWVLYTGNSYTSAAAYCRSKKRKKKHLQSAYLWYKKAAALPTDTASEKIALNRQLAEVLKALNEPINASKELLLNNFKTDPNRAESITVLLKEYMSCKKWHVAHILSTFCVNKYHQQNPFNIGAAEIEVSLYQWKIVLYHSICCYYTGRKEEARIIFNELLKFADENKEYIPHCDQLLIRMNSPYYLNLRKWIPWSRQNTYD
jgi:glycosyltransferase involved in cell wall biosynthesis